MRIHKMGQAPLRMKALASPLIRPRRLLPPPPAQAQGAAPRSVSAIRKFFLLNAPISVHFRTPKYNYNSPGASPFRTLNTNTTTTTTTTSATVRRSLHSVHYRSYSCAPGMTVGIPPKPPYATQPHISNYVKIVEVGPRDGLQNEKAIVPTATKLMLIEKLSRTGLSVIEAGAFVSPKWIPQMADTPQILQHLDRHHNKPAQVVAAASSRHGPAAKPPAEIVYPYLVPNLQGLKRALALGTANLKEVAIFASASEGFSQKNINCSVAESLDRFRPVLELCRSMSPPIRVRGYISMVISCPYDGPTPPTAVAEVTQSLLDMGCYEISLGDTNGTGTPASVSQLLTTILSKPYSIPVKRLACHFHDTYNQALVNSMTALYFGVRVFDSSVAGLGGCPYSRGATGNVSTEDLVYFLHGMGMETGVNLEKVSEVGDWISKELGRPNGSKVGPVLLGKKRLLVGKEEEGGDTQQQQQQRQGGHVKL